MKTKKPSSLIKKGNIFSVTTGSKFISVGSYEKEGEYKYIPRTKENMKAIVKLSGKPDIYENKKGKGKRYIWW